MSAPLALLSLVAALVAPFAAGPVAVATVAAGSSAAAVQDGPLAGLVRDAHAGDGVPEVEVAVYLWRSDDPADRGAEALLARERVRTDGLGRFSVELAPGPVTVSLYDPTTERALGSRHGAHPARDPDAWSFEVDLGPTVPIEVVTDDPFDPSEWRVRLVTRGAGGDDVPWPWRPLVAGSPPWARWGFVDGDAGGGRLEVQGRGLFRVGSASLERTVGTLAEAVRVPTEPRGALAARVVVPDGTPPPRPWVTAVDALGAVRHARIEGGAFELRGLAPGPVRVALHRPFGAPHVQRAEVEPEALRALELDLPAAPEGGKLLVELPPDLTPPAVLALEDPEAAPGSRPLATRVVGLDPMLGGAPLPFDHVPEGRWRLRVASADGRAWPPLDVEAPGTVRLAVPTGGAPSPIAALLAPPSGSPGGSPAAGAPPRTVRLHFRDARDEWDPTDLGAWALSLERCPSVAEAVAVGEDGTRWPADAAGVATVPAGTRLRVEAPGWRVFPSPGLAGGRPRPDATDVVVWLHPR